MGNKSSCSSNNQQQSNNYIVMPSVTQQTQVVDKNAFYHRKLILPDQDYYEHTKYKYLQNVWNTAVNNYNNESDKELKNAINLNMHLLIDDHNFKLVRRYISVQMTSELIPTTFKYIYKLARIQTDNGDILHNAVALVTMKLDVQNAKIADSYTGDVINHELLVDNKEYCCNEVEVFSFKIVGEKEDVMKVTPNVLDNTYTIVSNFDVKFQYTLGNHITELNFRTKGTGCYQGIHFFTNEDAAIKYTDKGMINQILGLPHITKSIKSNDSDDRTTMSMCHFNHGSRIMSTRISNTGEALLKYYNSMYTSEAHRNLKHVCNDMYGSWYLYNNFGVNSGGGYNMEIETIPDDLSGNVIRQINVQPPNYEV